MILLQTQALNANDILFRVTDVVYIVTGVITVLTAWFAFKANVEKINDRIDTEVLRGDEKRAAIKREFEILTKDQNDLIDRIKVAEKSFDALEVNLYRRIEEMDKNINRLAIETGSSIGKLSTDIGRMESAILKRLLDNK